MPMRSVHAAPTIQHQTACVIHRSACDCRRIKVDFSQSMYHQWKEYRKVNIDHASKSQRSSRPGEGILLAGGRFKLKSGAHGEGTGASLGLVGHGHGQSCTGHTPQNERSTTSNPKEFRRTGHVHSRHKHSHHNRGDQRGDAASRRNGHMSQTLHGNDRFSIVGDQRHDSRDRPRYHHDERDRRYSHQDRSRETYR